MFDQLVESNSEKGRAAKDSAFFSGTAVVLGTLAIALFVWSLFSTNVTLGEEDLALDTLVAPVPVPEAAPPPPAPPENQPKQQKVAAADAPKNFDVRQVLQASIDDTREPPKEVSTTQNQYKSVRDAAQTKIGRSDVDAAGDAPRGAERPGSGGGGQPVLQAKKPIVAEDDPPPPPAAKPSPEKPKVPATISGGVVNGKARNLVQPPYPAAAKAVRASGVVGVQVTIDEAGNVISASATSGHPLLRAAAVQAARASKFTPTQLSGQPVKVTGIINYNFTAQ